MNRVVLYAVLAAATSLGAGGCVFKSAYVELDAQLTHTRGDLTKTRADLDAERKARAQCDANAADLESRNGACVKRLEAMGQNVKDLESHRKTLATDLDAAQKQMEELRRAQRVAEQRAQQFRDLFAKFKSMIDSGKLKVEIRNGLMLVKLSDNILFDAGRTDLKPEGREAINEVSAILAGIPGRKFQVAGHTDNKPLSHHATYKSNWELSTARAVEVVQFMIKDGGMPGDRLSAAGFADQLPLATNDTEDGRRQNRRIEIVLLPNIEDLPPMDDIVKDSSNGAVK